MFAATTAGIYTSVQDAMNHMGRGFESEYFPDPNLVGIYAKRYEQYNDLGAFIEQQVALTQRQKNISPAALTGL
jgi:L-ribulokinase